MTVESDSRHSLLGFLFAKLGRSGPSKTSGTGTNFFLTVKIKFHFKYHSDLLGEGASSFVVE